MPARFGTLSGFRSGRGRPLGLILRRGWGGGRICRMKGLRWDIRANPMLLDVAPRGTPEICMISILVLSFCPVCHLLFVHSRGKKFRLARKKKKGAVLRRKGFRARRSVLFSLHSFFRSPVDPGSRLLVYSNRLWPGGTTRRIQDRKVSIQTATTFLQIEPCRRRAALKLFKHDLEALKKKVFQ